MLLDVLPHHGGFSYTSGTTYGHQPSMPVDTMRPLPHNLQRCSLPQPVMFINQCINISNSYIFMLFAHFVRCKGQIMLVFVRYKGQLLQIFVRYRSQQNAYFVRYGVQNYKRELIYASFLFTKNASHIIFLHFAVFKLMQGDILYLAFNREPPANRRFSVYGYRDYYSLSFSCSRRLYSFNLLPICSCILCQERGHGSSKTTTFIISVNYLRVNSNFCSPISIFTL
jgi:hypothetical protein